MAWCAERDQVPFGVVAGVAAKEFVMNLQIRHGAARLTPPTIATQDPLAQNLVGYRIKAHVRRFHGLLIPSRSVR